ncbi:kinesin-3 [Cavenderia fasciculata]|uniref:Kinesin-3 n=1 Tax=Cavenderia fasciculata TaxID=261658 RepID=F4PIU5_CACFS|nr:kinesin-3 [Cavenderia fasciculata]EGG24674.1 kinesin-3 [Cavenderia fasciculata]|eukprot:XP_004362525.1 kinesin-3 [Cavenderia fasciculata]
MSSGVKVAVRVRPFNSREKERNAECIVKMSGNSTSLVRPTALRANPLAPVSQDDEKSFTFDHSYWSFDSDDSNFASQTTVFDDLGREVLQNAWEGFNCSIFAYGQTGSGKSYSMLGYGEEKGIIPLVCEEMFNRINNTVSNENEQIVFKVEVSFMEIYNERVKDLLNPKNNKPGGLKVRNHPTTGPYVEDLSKLAVKSFPEIEMLMDEGSKARTVASTNMNATSSRSHAVFTIIFTQSKIDKKRGVAVDRVSKVSLVDLAGSERANSTGATGMRLKEGANINKSLSTLGKVISALAENSTQKKQVFVPYRDSVLTYLLKESLGGNSKTIMIAAISPADINYDETLSTLRYADSAKKIKTTATVNEDAQSKVIRELQTEVERLKQQILKDGGTSGTGGDGKRKEKIEKKKEKEKENDGLVLSLNEKIESYEKLMAELNKSWEEKLTESERIREERMAALKDMGVAIKVVSSIPHLVNLNEDPQMSESLIYYLKEGYTRIGRSDADTPQDIILNGLSIAQEHCVIQNKDGVVTIIPYDEDKDNRTHTSIYVNGNEITSPTVLNTGNRVILGNNHIFRFNHPEEAAKIARERNSGMAGVVGSPTDTSDQIVDYDFALNELASAQGTLAMSKHIGDKKEFQRQMKVLYEQMKSMEFDFDQETKERRERIAIIAVRRWRSKVYRKRLLNRISHLILQLNEANAISDTLSKNIDLSLYLYSIFPQPDQISDSDEIEIDWRMTQIGIKVFTKDTGATTMISSEEFMDRFYSMRELYQNDGKLEDDFEDPFKIQFDGASLIGVSHVYLKNLLYLIDIKRAIPVLDNNGTLKGYLNVVVSPKSNITEEEKSSIWDSEDDQEVLTSSGEHHQHKLHGLIGKQLSITIQFNGISDFKDENYNYDHIFSKYKFINDSYQTNESNSLITFKDEKTIIIESLTIDDIQYLESQYLAFEIWGNKISMKKETSPFSENALKQPISESFDFLASVNILEPQADGEGDLSPGFKPVHILEDADSSTSSTVTFRLRKEVATRQVVLKFIKMSPGVSVKDCKSVKITNTRVVGKPMVGGVAGAILSANNTPSTPSTPANRQNGPGQPQTPQTPYNASSNNLFSALNNTSMSTPNSNERGNSSFISNSASKDSLSTLLNGAGAESSSNTATSNNNSHFSHGTSTTTILPVVSMSKDTIIAEWTTDPTNILAQKTRKGNKLLFKITFGILFDGFTEEAFITKDISVKVLSDNLQGAPEGANTSMSNLLDRFKTHFKGENVADQCQQLDQPQQKVDTHHQQEAIGIGRRRGQSQRSWLECTRQRG